VKKLINDPADVVANTLRRTRGRAPVRGKVGLVSGDGSGLGPVTADSMFMLTTLDSHPGDRLRVSANGPAAAEAMRAVVQFVADGLGD
jgi:hypothetical protein